MSSDSTRTVLVVNDDIIQLHMIATQLEREGLRAIRCSGAEEALRVLGGEDRVDAIVTDLHMPGIDGWRLCRLLRSPEYAAFNHIPILVVSATFCGTDAEQVTVDLGANAFLPVPFEPSALRDRIHDMLAGRVPQAAPRALIVEQASTQPAILQTAFRAHRYAVMVASSGEEAAHVLGEGNPEIVILDYDLQGLADHQLLRAVKAPGSSTVVLVTTHDPSPTRAVECMREGADAYVRKPYDPEYVINLCEKARRERAVLRVEELLEERTIGLRDSEARFRSLVEGIDEIILVYDEKGFIQYINKVGAQRLEWTPTQLVGEPLVIILDPENRAARSQLDPAYADEREQQPVEMTYRSRTGKQVQVEASERAIIFNGKPATMTVACDVTERKSAQEEKARLESQLRQAQKMEAIGTLAGGVAHDFNNLLTVIMGHAQLLRTRTHPSDDEHQELRNIETAVLRAKALTDQLLGFARRGQHQNVPIDLRSTIREVVGFLQRTFDKNIVLKEELCEDATVIRGDPNQIHQVMLNLSVNARDAMPRGGALTYRTEMIYPDRELRRRLPWLTNDAYVLVSVSDTGCGIPQELQGRIFEPFFTTKDARSGTGMGLAMVYGIVKNHDGVIDVESTVKEGSTFRLYFPLATEIEKKPDSPREGALVSGKGKILLVDDDNQLREIAVKLLAHLGYEVITAAHGREALERYREHWQDIGLVILDMIMPEMGGPECYRGLRSINPTVRVVLITGFDKNLAVQELLDQGVQAFVQKPFDLNRFSKIIADAMDSDGEARMVPSR